MNAAIEARREILKHIEKLAEETADVMFHLSLKVIYDYLSDKMSKLPNPDELEDILDDLCKADNSFRKDKSGYYWREAL